ncbi:MAG: NADH-quinone oxidoreductase subunit J [Chthoniobacterales bacterium]|nr:NADH-quinone oxidoreductase subunit J [Chthoniobacterales bacterium]MCX7712431.1 NADH-quinone oxidoreductase subunit J [Chthoniobacterales bacterium]
MQLAIFWIFSVLMLLFAGLVVVMRNPVASALSLVMCFICLAGLYFTLDAFFIGIIQILVYAGAVMVLFLFIIMLLNLKEEVARRLKLSAFFGGGLVLCGFVYAMVKAVINLPEVWQTAPKLETGGISDVARIGFKLFETYNMPLQIVGVILLVATIGVVFLSSRQLR